MSWQAMKSERDERERNPFLSGLDAALLVGGVNPAYIMD